MSKLFEASHPILTVVAPAGFGKTTAVADWVQSSGRPYCWVRLERHDSDLLSLLGVLADRMSALVGPGRVQGVASSPPGGEDGERTIANAIIDDLAGADDGTVLVFEDLHHVDDPAAARVLRDVVDHLPAEVTVVVMSRSDPPLPLARLRASDRLTEVRADDLAFDRAESDELLTRAVGAELAGEVAETLHERIEGWAIGLQLASLSLSGASDPSAVVRTLSATDRYVADYLIDEVVDREPPELREFLFETSLLEELSPELCAAVSQSSHAAAVLDDLLDRNLFITATADGDGRYRYHQLFADLLSARMRRQDPDAADRVLRDAAEWHVEQGEIDPALRCLERAHDLDGAAELVMLHARPLLVRGEVGRQQSWLRLFPESYLHGRADLLLARSWGRFLAGRPAEAIADMQRIHEIATPEFLEAMAGQAELMQAVGDWYGGDQSACLAHSRRSLELLDELLDAADSSLVCVAHLYAGVSELVIGDADLARDELQQAANRAEAEGHLYAMFSARVALGALELRRGHLDHAEARFETTLELLDSLVPDGAFPLRGTAVMGVGLVALERLDLDLAVETFRRALGDLRRTVAVDYTALAFRLWADAESLRGEPDRAIEALAEGRAHLAEIGAGSAVALGFEAGAARVALRAGDLDAARAAITRAEVVAHRGEREFDNPELERLITAAHVDLATHGAEVSPERLAVVRELAGDRVGWRFETAALEARVHDAAGRPELAQQAAGPALVEALELGWLRPFFGAPASLLASIPASDPAIAERVARLTVGDGERAPSEAAPQPLVDPLTPRELEVLGEIAAGHTNAQIAERLFISVGTTKRHVANIFVKLPATHRTEAVARGRELGILV